MLEKKIKFLLVLLILPMVIISEVFGCTTFVIHKKDRMVYGSNFDFYLEQGHISVNKRDVIKTAFIESPEIKLSWVSKYGSVTFNQTGKEFPYNGMNEAGLVIENMDLYETQYPGMDERFGLMEVQWIQYALDNFATVNELIASSGSIRISRQSKAIIHFLVADRSGKSAVIEFINGEMKVYRGKHLPFPVLANSSYKDSLDYFQNLDTYPEGTESLNRFARAVLMTKEYKKKENIVDYSFEILLSVKQEHTQWSLVFDIFNGKIYYKTISNPEVRSIDLGKMDFSCETPAMYLDINHRAGESFSEYNSIINRQLIETIFNGVPFLQDTSTSFRDALGHYPETTTPLY
ncbi:MAG: linear amide C-N hydrolase [Desulfobacteraceae bacterium]|nr:linear amide C-N hydrolase [Desulfobacteraceae bacterium]